MWKILGGIGLGGFLISMVAKRFPVFGWGMWSIPPLILGGVCLFIYRDPFPDEMDWNTRLFVAATPLLFLIPYLVGTGLGRWLIH